MLQLEGEAGQLPTQLQTGHGHTHYECTTHAAQRNLVDCECPHLSSHSKLVLDPIFSPIHMTVAKRQHATKLGLHTQ